jgi:ribosomal protein L27
MHMRFSNRFFVLVLLTSTLIATAALAAPPAAIKPSRSTNAAANGLDAATRAKLVGEHALTVQWIGWGDLSQAGKLVVKDRGKTLWVEGEQIGRGENEGDYLKMSGKIVSASKDGFVFEGDILIRVHHNANGEECKRSGTFTFKTKGTRKYWRLQEMDSPCDTVTDYVDVYFRGI